MTNTVHKFTAHKFLLGILAAIMLITAMSPMAFASQEDLGRRYDGSFSSPWQKTATNGKGASLTYGYNTWLVNEDYAWADHTTLAHCAEIRNNGQNWYRGPIKAPGHTSKKEVTHAGSSVSYYCCFS